MIFFTIRPFSLVCSKEDILKFSMHFLLSSIDFHHFPCYNVDIKKISSSYK